MSSNSSTSSVYDANICVRTCCSSNNVEETLPRQCIACVRFCWQGTLFNGSSSCTEFCRLGGPLDSEGLESSSKEEVEGLRTAVLVLAPLSGCLLLILLCLLARGVRGALRRRWRKPRCRPPIFNPRLQQQRDAAQGQEEEGELVAGSEVQIQEVRTSGAMSKVAALTNGFAPGRRAAAKEGALLCGRTEWSATLSTTPPQGPASGRQPEESARYARLDVDAGSVCETLTDDEFHDAWSPGNTPANARRSFAHAHDLSARQWL